MIPTLYDKTGNNKIGDLNDCIECLVEEERNGIFELTMVYPANSSILESIVYDNIIVADANDYLKSQKFRIYNTRKLMANRIEVCARHISFDLAHDWVDSISVENQSCEYALNTIFRNSQFSSHYKGHSDIINAQNFKVNKVTCLEAVGGTSGSIIDTYGTGAEIIRDNTNIHVLNRRGRDNDVTIEYRKNLTGLEVEEDTTDLVTRIMPYAIYTDEDNQEVEVRGDFIDSPLINNYAHPYVKYIDYSEKFEDDEVPTATKLNNLATKEYTNNKVDIPKCNYKIEFIPLSKCAGYEGLEDRINLCDVVTIKDSRYSIDTQAKVIKVVFDVLRGRYDSMELGEPRTTLGDIIGGTGDGPTQGPPGPPGPQGPAGSDGSIGDFPETLPEVPNITAKVYGFANIEISWTFENKIYYSYELYASKTKGFTPNTFNLIFSGQASTYLYQAEPNETWYFRACALNTHGQRTEFSEEVAVSTVKISDLSNYVESAAIGDALIGELNLGRGWYGELRGNYIDAKQMSVTDGNGKRTLDIDSFGNVNLDVTSLKIRANSVATESFVTTAKNEAINSANNTLNTTITNYYTKTQTDSQISVAKNTITQSVANTYETKSDVTSKINGVNNSISSLTTRVTNAESKITDTSITNTVKKSFYTKEETNNQITSKGYQTSSQVQQTVDALQLKFTQSGGYNLIRNSSGLNGTQCWTGTATLGTATNSNIGGACDKYMYLDNGTTTSEKYAYSSRFKLKPSTTYTLTGWFHNFTKCPNFDVFVLSSTSVDSSDNGISHTNTHHLINAQNTNGTWKKYTVSFTTPAGCKSGIVRIDNNGYNSKGSDSNRVHWSALILSEGTLEVPWTQHPNEIYDGITTIDKDGVTVKGQNNAYTNFNSTGMNSFNNSGQQTLGIKNGGITFHPYSSNQLGAYITQSALHGNSVAANGLAISTANNGTYISLGTSSLNDTNTTLNMDQALTVSANDNFQPKGINLWKDTHAHGYGIRQLSHLRLAGSGAIQFDYLNTSPSTIYEAVDGGHSLYVMGGYQMHLGVMDGEGVPKGVIWMQNSTNTHSYTHWNFHNYTMYNMKTASTFANVASRKLTESYGVMSNVDGIRYLYRDVELINGKAIRSIPLVYSGATYDIVSVVCKGRGGAWVEKEDENRFEIQGDCKSVNVEIIIYPSEAVMTASTQQLEEAPTLELPKKTEPEEALLITNEAV